MTKYTQLPLRTKTFRSTYNPIHTASLHHPPSHSGPNSLLLQTAVLEADRARPSKGLWWSMLKVPNAACPTPVVRNWATRRVREAFVRALKEKGLNENGLRLEKGGWRGIDAVAAAGKDDGTGANGKKGVVVSRKDERVDVKKPRGKARVREIHGSLVFRVELQAAKASSQEVEEEARALVHWLYQREVPAGNATSKRGTAGFVSLAAIR